MDTEQVSGAEYHKKYKYIKLKKKEKMKVIDQHLAFKTLKLAAEDKNKADDGVDDSHFA